MTMGFRDANLLEHQRFQRQFCVREDIRASCNPLICLDIDQDQRRGFDDAKGVFHRSGDRYEHEILVETNPAGRIGRAE